MMNETLKPSNNEKVVTLKDIWAVFLQRLWIMILVAVLSVAAVYVVNKVAIAPEYESTATLYILRQENEEASTSDFSLALNVVNDCDYLLKSHSVLDEVIDSLGLNMEYAELYNSISTYNPDGTRILEVTVTAATPEEAKRIVDRVCQVGPEKITEAMGFQQVNLYEYGKINTVPSNAVGLGGYILVAMIAAVATYAICLFAFLLDDRIRSAEDIEQQLGLSILGEIPDADSPKKNNHYGYYRRDPDAGK